LVIGIPRDGIMVAYLVSIYRNIPMTDLTSFCAGIIYKSGIKHRKELEIKNILMVDDICATGRAMRDAKEQIKEHLGDYKLYCAALYFNKKLNTDFSIDFYGCELIGPRAYEWTMSDAVYLPATMMDFDGILCPDCPHEDDDDGERYRNWLQTVPLKIRPMNIGTIITWRREKYRDLTEAWLKRNRITYGELIMAEHEKWPGPVEFKAYYYKSSNARLLIDSSVKQAERIYQLTQRPTVCFETNESWGVA
jgi:orotate phosphoribosyltransferase